MVKKAEMSKGRKKLGKSIQTLWGVNAGARGSAMVPNSSCTW